MLLYIPLHLFYNFIIFLSSNMRSNTTLEICTFNILLDHISIKESKDWFFFI